MARAHVFVLAAVRTARGEMDGIPVSLIEAMGIGVPVVSTHVSGIPELIEDGRSGLLVAAGDASALADAIERLQREPALAQAIGAQARRRVETAFSLKRSVDALLAAWDETAAASAAQVRRDSLRTHSMRSSNATRQALVLSWLLGSSRWSHARSASRLTISQVACAVVIAEVDDALIPGQSQHREPLIPSSAAGAEPASIAGLLG